VTLCDCDIAITARTGAIRLHGKGDQVRTVPILSGIVQIVLAVGEDAKLPGLRPHRLRRRPPPP
jgi:hypothetical protein